MRGMGSPLEQVSIHLSVSSKNFADFQNNYLNAQKNALFVGHGKICKVLSSLPVDIVFETLMERSIQSYESASD